MTTSKQLLLTLALAFATAAPAVGGFSGAARAASSADALNKDADEALQALVRANPVAADIAKQARFALVFPNIVKAGLVFGGSYGEGVLRKGSAVVSYYNSVSASWGLQAGAQSFGYVVFLMNQQAENYVMDSKGWEIGVGPTVVIVNEGVAKNLSTSTLKDDAYAFVFDQKGLMAGVSIEGTKISKIKR